MNLTDASVQRFLATKQIALLATVRADGAPLAMPMWFLHDAATLTMISEEGTKKVHHLRRDPRVCVVVESGEDAAHIRGMTVLGRAEFLTDGPGRRALPRHALQPRHVQDRPGARQELGACLSASPGGSTIQFPLAPMSLDIRITMVGAIAWAPGAVGRPRAPRYLARELRHVRLAHGSLRPRAPSGRAVAALDACGARALRGGAPERGRRVTPWPPMAAASE